MSPNHSVVNHLTARIRSALASSTYPIDPIDNRLPAHMVNQKAATWWSTPLRLGLCLALFLIVMSACGPGNKESSGDLTTETIRIAQEYMQSGDIADARAQLEKLDVANPTQ